MTHNIVTLAPHHLDDVWRIEQAAHAFPWAESLIRKEPNKLALNCGLEINGQLVGYCFGQLVAGEATLLNIAIDPACQGKGYGKILLEGFIELGRPAKRRGSLAGSQGKQYPRLPACMSRWASTKLIAVKAITQSENGREDALIMTYLVM